MNKQQAAVLSLEDALLPCAKTSIRLINTLQRMRHQKHNFSWPLSLLDREHTIYITKVLNYITGLQLEHVGQKAKTRASLGQIIKWIKFVFRNFYLGSYPKAFVWPFSFPGVLLQATHYHPHFSPITVNALTKDYDPRDHKS